MRVPVAVAAPRNKKRTPKGPVFALEVVPVPGVDPQDAAKLVERAWVAALVEAGGEAAP